MDCAYFDNDDLILSLHIQPKASRDKIVGLHGENLKVAITAPPIDGKANSHLKKFFSKEFKVAKSKIIILKGELGRHKLVKITAPKKIPAEIIEILPKDH